jgi:DNA-binding response OmpR family regulator
LLLQFLLVEDDLAVSEILKGALEHSCEASVTSAGCGAAAARALSSCRFDFALIDVLLPDISGYDLAKRVVDCNVPVLLVSGHPDEQQLCELVSYPHLNKPFSLDALSKSVTSILRNSRKNIARVQRSYNRLMVAHEKAKRIAIESNRLVKDSRRIRIESIRLLSEATGNERTDSRIDNQQFAR